MENAELIAKTFDLAGLEFGGELNEIQQDQFIVLVKKFSQLLQHVRFVRMRIRKETVDKFHISEPITEAIDENTTSANLAQGQFNNVDLIATKLRTAWDVTTEQFRNNIEGSRFEDTLMESLSERMATDFELLSIQGDTTLGAANPTERLLSRLDGWDILTAGSHIVDQGGVNVDTDLWSKLWRALPAQFRADPGVRWILSDVIANDWTNVLAARATNAGDAAIGGSPLKPLGRPMLVVPLIPSDQDVDIAAATPAQVQGTAFGPFQFETGVNDTLVIEIDNSTNDRTVTFPEGVLETVVVANEINKVMVANSEPLVARDDDQGRIFLETTTTGAAAEIDIKVASTSLAELGLTDGAVTGAAGGAGSVKEGSFIWFTNPQNFIFGMVDGTRVFSRFNPDFDRQETRIFNEVAVAVENIDAVAKATNVRRSVL